MAAPKVDIMVKLLTALIPFAGNATTLPLNDEDQPLDYSRLIGGMVINHENKLSQLTSSLNTLYGYVTTLQNQMATILANGLTVPQISLPSIMPDSAYYNVEVVVSTIGNDLATLRTATGDSDELTAAVNYQNKIYNDTDDRLEDQSSFTTPSSTLAELNGWVLDTATVADTIKNMWITLNDLRKAYQTKFSPGIITSCTGVTVAFTTYRDIPNNRITLFFLGNSTIPDGFIDTDANGAYLTITDGSSGTPNVYNTYVNVSQANNSVSGVTIELNGTNINLYTTLRFDLVYSLTNGAFTCSGTRTYTGITTTATPCVALTLTPLSTTAFTGVFTPAVFGSNKIITYSITTYSDPACTSPISPSSTVTYTNPTQSQLSYNVSSGLATGITYYVRMSVGTGNNTPVACSLIQSVKTL